MTDAGFFRGTSADQDNRFANKHKKLLKELNFSPILNTKLNVSKIDISSLKPWIEQKIKDVLEKDDEILSESIHEHLAEKEPDGKDMLMLITGFVDESKASKFMEELWTKLIDLQDSSNGVGKSVSDNVDNEVKSKETSGGTAEKVASPNEDNTNPRHVKSSKNSPRRRCSESSRSMTPPSRSVSKSPGNHKLDERSRGRPRKRLQEETSRDSSEVPATDVRRADSRSGSSTGSRSHTPDVSRRSPARVSNEVRRRSRSSSHSKRSGSRSPSRSYSRSGSSSRSPRNRPRSPYGHPHRGRRSRSRSRSRSRDIYRHRSRSPRSRRGYGHRGSYRGSFAFQDRRRGAGFGPIRRRPSPWGRRRFSPRSPIRRRRTPSFSPRRRRSPSPYHRRSRSRSPPGHMMSRVPYPRAHMQASGHMDMIGGRHIPHHDLHRQMAPMPRSPGGPMDYRGHNDGQLLPRHSPGPAINKQSDLPTAPHGITSSQPGPSGPALHSPPSSRKKHKKDKKHRKHKKSRSRRHRSISPEKKKKHKKHKKTKKHKSH